MKSNNLIIIFALFLVFSSCKTKENSAGKGNETITKENFISLYRSGCFGTCPSYKITINGDGSFLYFGKSNVKHLGSYKGNLTKEDASKLFKDLQTYKWNSYPEKYPIDNVDFPQFTLEYSSSKTNKVVHANSKAAKQLIDLSEKIDDLIKDAAVEKLN